MGAILRANLRKMQRLITRECGETSTVGLLHKQLDAVVEYMKVYYAKPFFRVRIYV